MQLQGPTAMLTLPLAGDEPTLATARELLGLAPEEVDEEFGLVPIDPESGTFAILVTAEAGARVGGRRDARGPLADPPVEPSGSPRPAED